MSWDLEAERDLLAAAGSRDFEFFARTVIGLTHPQNSKGRWWLDSVHQPLCRWFQDQCEAWLAARKLPPKQQERRYLALLIPRNCAKSLLITQVGMLWLQLQDPDLSIFIGNETLPLAKEFLGTIRKWLEGRRDKYGMFGWLYGSWKSEEGTWRLDNLVHAARMQERAAPSFGVWSPTSALTGRHPDVLCMDDLVSYDSLKTDSDWFEFAYGHMTDLIPVVEPNGLVILVGTRYSDADPFGRCFRADGIASRAGMPDFPLDYQVRKHPRGRWHVYFLSGKNEAGEPTIPTVWSRSEMDFYEARDPIKFANQVLNRPQAHRLRPLSEEQFDRQLVKEAPKKAFLTFHSDTAFKISSRQAAGSETALVVVAHDLEKPGHTCVLESINDAHLRADTFSDLLLGRFRYWAPQFPIMAITDEWEMAGKLGLWEQYLRDRWQEAFPGGEELMPAFHAMRRPKGEHKQTRIANALAFVVKRQVTFLESNPGLAVLRSQLVNQPYAFPNDVADAWADHLLPEFFSGILPQLAVKAEKVPMGAWEERLKPFSHMENDTILERPPIRGGGQPAVVLAGARAERESAATFFFPDSPR